MAVPLTTLLAASEATPPSMLTALAHAAMPSGQRPLTNADRDMLRAIAANPATPPATLDTIAATVTDQHVRAALVTRAASVPSQVRGWLASWKNPRPQLSVWRAAVRAVPDPDGTLADLARTQRDAAWLQSEILDSDNTSETARVAAALALADRPKAGPWPALKATERSRILSVARRDAGAAAAIAAKTTDVNLRRSLLQLSRRADEVTERRRSVQRTPARDLAAWMSTVTDEQQILDVLSQDRRAATWRAAAQTCRPGWTRLANAVVDDAEARNRAGESTGRTNAIAVLANSTINSDARLRAAVLVASDTTGTGAKVLQSIQRAAPNHASRETLARAARSYSVVHWLAVTAPGLSTAALDNLADALGEPGSTRWSHSGSMVGLLCRPELSVAARGRLVDSAVRRIGFPTWDGDNLAFTLPWRDDDRMRVFVGTSGWSVRELQVLLWAAIAERTYSDGQIDVAAVDDVPAAVLGLMLDGCPVLAGAIGGLAVAVARRVGADLDSDVLALRILAVVSEGFDGTIGELIVAMRGALAVPAA